MGVLSNIVQLTFGGCSSGTLWTGTESSMVQNANVSLCLASPDSMEADAVGGRVFLGSVEGVLGTPNTLKVVYLDSPYTTVSEWTNDHEMGKAITALRIVK